MLSLTTRIFWGLKNSEVPLTVSAAVGGGATDPEIGGAGKWGGCTCTRSCLQEKAWGAGVLLCGSGPCTFREDPDRGCRGVGGGQSHFLGITRVFLGSAFSDRGAANFLGLWWCPFELFQSHSLSPLPCTHLVFSPNPQHGCPWVPGRGMMVDKVASQAPAGTQSPSEPTLTCLGPLPPSRPSCTQGHPIWGACSRLPLP